MSNHFEVEDFKIIEKVWILINSAESEVEQEEFEICFRFKKKWRPLL